MLWEGGISTKTKMTRNQPQTTFQAERMTCAKALRQAFQEKQLGQGSWCDKLIKTSDDGPTGSLGEGAGV